MDSRLQFVSSGSVGLLDKRLALKLEVPIPVEQMARRDQVRQLGVPKLTVPIGGTLDDPVVAWDVMRGESADLISLIRDRIVEEAPGTAAALGAIEGLAGGDLDNTIAAGFDLIKELRDRKRTAQEAADPPAVGEASAEPKRPIRDALRGFLRGKGNKPP